MRFDGAIPLFHDVLIEIREHMPGNGFLYASAIFCYIWQQRDEHDVFDKPRSEIEKIVGVDPKTAKRYMKYLVDNDWLLIVSKPRKGKSAVYKISETRKYRFTISIRPTSIGKIPYSQNHSKGHDPLLERDMIPNFDPINHDNNDDIVNIPILWSSIGLGGDFLRPMLRVHSDDIPALHDLLLAWADWIGAHPHNTLKPQLIYTMLKNSQYPPEDEPPESRIDPDLLDAARRSDELWRERLLELEAEANNGAWVDELRRSA